MDAPPCGRAVSDAPPHSGLSPIAVFRHYCSRHLNCIVPFSRRGPSHPRALPRFPATTASSDYCSRLRYWQFSQVPLLNFPNMRPSYAPPRPRSPNRIGHEVLTSHIETCWSRGFRVNETLRRKFTCVAAYFFVRQDSRTSVALCTACPPNRMSISLRFSSFQLIVHAELCLAYLYQQALHPLDPTYTPSSRRIRNLSSVTGLVHPRAWRVPSTHPPLRMTCLADKHC